MQIEKPLKLTYAKKKSTSNLGTMKLIISNSLAECSIEVTSDLEIFYYPILAMCGASEPV